MTIMIPIGYAGMKKTASIVARIMSDWKIIMNVKSYLNDQTIKAALGKNDKTARWLADFIDFIKANTQGGE